MNLMERLEHTVTTLDGYCPIERPINPDGPEAAALIRELVDALEEAREAIASLPEDALGMAQIAFGAPSVDVYPIRDELLSKLTALKAKASTNDR